MKIPFDDGSFILVDESANEGKVVTITMCGLTRDRNSLTISSSELELDQAKQICEFLQEVIKKV